MELLGILIIITPIIILVSFIALLTIQILGTITLTKFVFKTRENNGKYCLDLTQHQINFAKMTMIIYWLILIIILLPLFYGLYNIFTFFNAFGKTKIS